MSDLIIEIKEIPGYIADRTIITCAVLMFFSWVTVSLRYYTKLFIVGRLGADDIWMGLALVCQSTPLMASTNLYRSCVLVL
jgi:hypothetical protein